MKPGSSSRCESKHGHLRCHLAAGHDREHQAPVRDATVRWDDE